MQYREMKIRKTYIFASIPSLSGRDGGGGGGGGRHVITTPNPQIFQAISFFFSFLEIYGSVDKT